jgi:hypothetical protein
MAAGDAADDVRFLHVSSDDTSRFIDEMKNNNWQSIPLCSDGILYLEEYLCHFSPSNIG